MDRREFGTRIARLRTQRGYTQEQLARQLGVKRSVVSYYESGERLPSVDVLIGMGQVFHVSMDYLLKGEEAARALDVSGLAEPEIDLAAKVAKALRGGKQKQQHGRLQQASRDSFPV